MKFNCAHCGKVADRPTGHVNRSRARGDNLYCSRECSGLGRRTHKTKAQKVAEKRLYDIEYRRKNREMLRLKKKAYFKRTYDPERARIERKKNMARHVEYCRQPEYRAKKHLYDIKRNAKKSYGPLADAALLLKDLVSNINERITHYESSSQNQSVRNPQTRAAQEGKRSVRDRNRTAQGERP